MNHRFHPRAAWVVLTLSAAAGCGDAPTPPPAQAATPSAPAPPVSEPEQLPEAAAAPVAAAYTPPYPDRADLFEPPQRSRAVARRSDDGDDESVELIGFVAVDVPRAVLSIEGVVTAVEAGGQKYGIQVISITPPEAVLQRGRNRWTASLD